METPPLPTPEELPEAPSAPRLEVQTVAVLATVLVFMLFLVSGVLVSPLNMPFGLWFSEVFVFGGLGWFVLKATRRSPVEYTGLRFPGLAPAVFGLLLGVVNFFAVVVPLQYLSQSLMPESWQDIYDVSALFHGQSLVELVLIVAGVSIAAPLFEEFFFRGIFLRGLMAPGGSPTRALLLSSVIFSAFHLDPVGFLARVELGLVFGLLLVRTGSLWPSLLAHAANNGVSTALYFIAREFESPQQDVSTQTELTSVLGLSALGLFSLGVLLSSTRSYPGLLGHSPLSREPQPPVPLLPFPRLLRLAVPWVLSALLVLAGYISLDKPGIQVSEVDHRYPLRALPEKASEELKAEREALYRLRVQARRGEVPLQDYTEERKRQSRSHPSRAHPSR